MKLEIIATSIDDVERIIKSNADRIEYCSNMEAGGLTPNLKEVRKALELDGCLPINVMIRPSDKNYHYTWLEFQLMKHDVRKFSKLGINGLVFGILEKDTNKINVKRIKKLVKIAKAKNKEVTFHRAIDMVPNYDDALKTLHELKVDTILTTGGLTPIMENLKTLSHLKELNEVIVLGGSGVNVLNAKELSKHVDQLHVGSSIRDNGWDSSINIEMINAIKTQIK